MNKCRKFDGMDVHKATIVQALHGQADSGLDPCRHRARRARSCHGWPTRAATSPLNRRSNGCCAKRNIAHRRSERPTRARSKPRAVCAEAHNQLFSREITYRTPSQRSLPARG